MEQFKSFLKEYSLKTNEDSEIADGSTRRSSFLMSFQACLGISERNLNDALKFKAKTELMNTVLMKEYGQQKKWIDIDRLFEEEEDFFPVLFAVASVSSFFKVRTVLICDELNMSFIHSGHFVIVLEPLEIERDDIILTLTEDGILRTCTTSDPEKFDRYLQSLPEYCNISFEEQLEEEDLNQMEEIDVIEITEKGETAPVNLDSYDNEACALNESLFINEYIETYSDSNGRPKKEAYSNKHRINFIGSDYRAQNNEKVKFSKTIDIDGFFAIVEPKDVTSCIKGFGTMIEAVETTKPATIQSIAKIARDVNVPEFVKLRPVQIAYLDGRKQFELYICFAFDKTSSEATRKGLKVVELVEGAHQTARKFPCGSECPHEKEHKSVACSSAINMAQIKVRQFTWDYSKKSFNCLLRNLNNSIEGSLQQLKGVRFFFMFRTIGTKNRYISENSSNMHTLLTDMLSGLNINSFNAEGDPRAYIDISLKFVPYTLSGTEKVSIYLIAN